MNNLIHGSRDCTTGCVFPVVAVIMVVEAVEVEEVVEWNEVVGQVGGVDVENLDEFVVSTIAVVDRDVDRTLLECDRVDSSVGKVGSTPGHFKTGSNHMTRPVK